MKNQAISYGKIILIGEHSVVYNQPAIAIPFFGAKIEVEVEESETLTFNSELYQGAFAAMPESLNGIKVAIESFFADYRLSLSNITFNVESSIPYERGMGSSAAITKASITALFKFYNLDYTDEDVLKYVNISEEIYHGNPSGIDSNIIVYNKPLYYTKGAPLQFFEYNLDAYLVVADTNIKGNTKFAVSKVKAYLDEKADRYQLITDLGKLAYQAYTSLLKNNKMDLGKIMNKAQHILKTLTISNDVIDNLVDVALTNGALGAKLTGGGLGGCIICLCEDLLSANAVSETLLTAGASNTWIMNMKEGTKSNES